MNSVSLWARALREYLAVESRILLFRWRMGKGHGEKAVEVLRKLDPPGTPKDRDERLQKQFARWRPYLRQGTVVPLTWVHILAGTVAIGLTAAILVPLGRLVPWVELVDRVIGTDDVITVTPPPAPPEVPTWNLRLKGGEVAQVVAEQGVRESSGKLYLETIERRDGKPVELPFERFDGESETVGELRIRRFVQERGEPIYLVWRGESAADGQWLWKEGVESPVPEPPPPPEEVGDDWGPLPEAGVMPVSTDCAVQSAPASEADTLLRTEAEGTLPLSGNVSVKGESLWLGVVFTTAEGRLKQGWIEGKPSPASVVVLEDEQAGVRLQGARTLRETPAGKTIRPLAIGEDLVLSGRSRWVNKFLWLHCRVTKGGAAEEGWVGFNFELKRSNEEP